MAAPRTPEHRELGRVDLMEAFRAVGLCRGDLVYFQVCAEGESAERDPPAFCELLYDSLREVRR